MTHLPYLIMIWKFKFLKDVLFVKPSAEMVTILQTGLGMNVQLTPSSGQVQETSAKQKVSMSS